MFVSWKVPYNFPSAPFPRQKKTFCRTGASQVTCRKTAGGHDIPSRNWTCRIKNPEARMFSIVKKLILSFAGSARKTSVSRKPVPVDVDPSAPEEALSSRTHGSAPGSLIHRNLCLVILRDTLRMYGIPREWVGIEVRNLSRHASIVHLQINFVIRHWHEGLLKFVPALQKQFLQSLQSFDPDTDYSGQVVFWRFSAKCDLPYTEMPEPSYWDEPGLSDDPLQSADTISRS